MLCDITYRAPAHSSRPVGVSCAIVRRHRVVARAGEGIQDLIKRDRKEVELTDAFDDEPAAPPAPATTSSPSSNTTSSKASSKPAERRRTGPKSRRQRQADMASAADAESSSSSATAAAAQPRFKRCKDAIDAGLEAFAGKQYDEAIQLFNLALELPGNGAYRLSGSPREYACPSDAEEHAALYNMACCYAQLGQQQAALTCLESILESGFKDTQSITTDPDLKPVQGQELQALINKYTGIGGLFSKLLKNNKEEVLVSDQNKNKPWIMW